MNRQEFEDTARRYREEMFRMYAAQSIEPKPKPEPVRPTVQSVRQKQPERNPPQGNRPNIPQDSQPNMPQSIPQNPPQDSQPNMPQSIPQNPSRDSQPNMPQSIPQNPPQDFPPEPPASEPPAVPQQNDPPEEPFVPEPETDAAEPELPKRAYTGIIRIHVFTAQGALPVAGAAVTVTRATAGQTDLISLQITDQSGSVSPLTVPAPPPSEDQRNPAFFAYDISVQASGYYREQSTDVPVFPNVTSVQSFDLIPLPAGGDESGSITYYNNIQKY